MALRSPNTVAGETSFSAGDKKAPALVFLWALEVYSPRGVSVQLRADLAQKSLERFGGLCCWRKKRVGRPRGFSRRGG